MKKVLGALFIMGLLLVSCNKDDTGDPLACKNQSQDFQSCLSCCEDNGFSGASLPMDDNGNYLDCECQN